MDLSYLVLHLVKSVSDTEPPSIAAKMLQAEDSAVYSGK